MKINDNNSQCLKTITDANQHWQNQELKFLCVKKQELNQQLYKTHLECACFWQNNWYVIETSIDNKLQRHMETYYTYLNTKLDRLQAKHRQPSRASHNNREQHQFYARIKNSNHHQICQGRNRNTNIRPAI